MRVKNLYFRDDLVFNVIGPDAEGVLYFNENVIDVLAYIKSLNLLSDEFEAAVRKEYSKAGSNLISIQFDSKNVFFCICNCRINLCSIDNFIEGSLDASSINDDIGDPESNNVIAVKAVNIPSGNNDPRRYSSVIMTQIDDISKHVYIFDSLSNVLKLYDDSDEKLYDFETRLKMVYTISNRVIPEIPLMIDMDGNLCIELEREFFVINLASKDSESFTSMIDALIERKASEPIHTCISFSELCDQLADQVEFEKEVYPAECSLSDEDVSYINDNIKKRQEIQKLPHENYKIDYDRYFNTDCFNFDDVSANFKVIWVIDPDTNKMYIRDTVIKVSEIFNDKNGDRALFIEQNDFLLSDTEIIIFEVGIIDTKFHVSFNNKIFLIDIISDIVYKSRAEADILKSLKHMNSMLRRHLKSSGYNQEKDN